MIHDKHHLNTTERHRAQYRYGMQGTTQGRRERTSSGRSSSASLAHLTQIVPVATRDYPACTVLLASEENVLVECKIMQAPTAARTSRILRPLLVLGGQSREKRLALAAKETRRIAAAYGIADRG